MPRPATNYFKLSILSETFVSVLLLEPIAQRLFWAFTCFLIYLLGNIDEKLSYLHCIVHSILKLSNLQSHLIFTIHILFSPYQPSLITSFSQYSPTPFFHYRTLENQWNSNHMALSSIKHSQQQNQKTSRRIWYYLSRIIYATLLMTQSLQKSASRADDAYH